jgi:ATP synthase protein I
MIRPPPSAPEPAADPDPAARELDERIARFAERRARARARRGPSLWAQATWVGTVGWLIAVPIVGGALLGHLLDRRLDSGITWAMAGMSLGVLIAGYALWRTTVQAREPDEPTATGLDEPTTAGPDAPVAAREGDDEGGPK